MHKRIIVLDDDATVLGAVGRTLNPLLKHSLKPAARFYDLTSFQRRCGKIVELASREGRLRSG